MIAIENLDLYAIGSGEKGYLERFDFYQHALSFVNIEQSNPKLQHFSILGKCIYTMIERVTFF